MFTSDTLSWSSSIASLLITFGVAVVKHDKLIVGISHHILSLRSRNVVPVESRVSLLNIRASSGEEVLIIYEAIEVVAEVIRSDRRVSEICLG